MTFVLPAELADPLPHPFLIITEGMGDAHFVDKLLEFNNIANCSVGCPSQQSVKGMGKEAFARYFGAIQVAKTRAKSVPLRGLLVLADANGNAGDSFNSVVAALNAATFPVPPQPFQVEGVAFKIAVYLMPGPGQTGTLEHLLLTAVFGRTAGLETCLNDFAACSGGLTSPNPNMQAKMRMSALAATFCTDNPWCSLAYMWSDAHNPVPIDSPHFNHFRNFLIGFVA